MNNILLVMKFWDDGQPDSTRIRNVNYTWVKLKELSKFLKENGILCEPKLYDFSPEKIIEESMTRFSINNDGNLISTSKGYGLTYGGILVDSMNYSHRDIALNFVLDVMYVQ